MHKELDIMDTKNRIYIAPKPGRIPRRYEFIDGEQRHQARWIALWLLLGAAFWGCVYLWIRQ